MNQIKNFTPNVFIILDLSPNYLLKKQNYRIYVGMAWSD